MPESRALKVWDALRTRMSETDRRLGRDAHAGLDEEDIQVFKQVVDASFDAVGMATPDGQHYYQNQAFDKMFGSIVGGSPLSVYADEAVGREVFETLQAGQEWSGEVTMRGREGQPLDILLRAYPVKQAGEVIALVGVHTDITARKQAEAALQESEARNRAILNALPDMMFVQARDGTYLDYYAARRDDLYSEPRQFLGKKPQDIFPAAFVTRQLDVIAQALATGEVQSYEYQLPIAAQMRHFEARIVPYGQDKILSVIREITDRKQAQVALQESQEQFRNIVQKLPIGVYIYVLEADDRLVFRGYNPAANQVVGVDCQQFIGKTLEEAFPPLAELEVPQRYREAAARGTPWFSEQIDYQDGAISGAYEVWAFQTKPGQVAVIFNDITDRKLAQAERERLMAQIHEQARRMEQILATVPEGVLLLDAEGRVLQANPVAESDLVVLAEAAVGDVVTHLGNRELGELLTSPPTRGLWHEARVGRQIFEIIARPVEPDGGSRVPEYWVLVINEVTQEREVQAQLQQQERLAVVGQLAAGIAHDFNNILATIVLYAQMVNRSPALSEREREQLQVITQQGWHATRLIEQILDFSRRAVLERRSLDLLPLLKEQVQLLSRTLPENIALALDYEPDEYIVDADPTRMQQMIANLAVNARDAMPEGGTLRFALRRVEEQACRSPLVKVQAAQWIRLTVADTGVGIPSDALPHIFEPFFTTKGPGKGAGLGLAQVHGIVGQHGGHVNVESQPGMGTTFTIDLPAPGDAMACAVLPETSTIPQGQGEVVLIVEDEATLRAALREVLELLNYHVLVARDGRAALDVMAAQGARVDLVVSDVVMPGMGGIALFRALREAGWQTPVLFLTGHPMGKELEGLRAEGASAWLLKPPSLERLGQVIAEMLAEARGDTLLPDLRNR